MGAGLWVSMQAQPYRESNQRPARGGKHPVVLIADDDRINLMVAKKMLLKILPDAEILEAPDGENAIALYRRYQPELILMDLQMPNTDGYTATQVILEHAYTTGRTTAIIALTAGSIEGERERCLASGMSDFLSKPLAQANLREVVETVLKPAQ